MYFMAVVEVHEVQQSGLLFFNDHLVMLRQNMTRDPSLARESLEFKCDLIRI